VDGVRTQRNSSASQLVNYIDEAAIFEEVIFGCFNVPLTGGQSGKTLLTRLD
jgi:hypothetical protein